MESSSSSAKASEPYSSRWARFIGTTVALLTLTIPMLAISYFSSPNSNLPLQNSSFLLPPVNTLNK